MLWTTRCVDAAVTQLKAEGHESREEDISRLCPLKHRDLNLLGRHSFTASVPGAGDLRPLRDPDAPDLDEDDGSGPYQSWPTRAVMSSRGVGLGQPLRGQARTAAPEAPRGAGRRRPQGRVVQR